MNQKEELDRYLMIINLLVDFFSIRYYLDNVTFQKERIKPHHEGHKGTPRKEEMAFPSCSLVPFVVKRVNLTLSSYSATFKNRLVCIPVTLPNPLPTPNPNRTGAGERGQAEEGIHCLLRRQGGGLGPKRRQAE
jgi:hypothetical protein